MKLRSPLLFLMLTAAAACAGSQAEEPVSIESSPRVPDAPGDAGETAEKPAGEGQANGAPAPQGTPSQPAVQSSPTPGDASTGVMVANTDVNVRSAPDKTSSVVRVLKKGTKVDVKSCKRGWCQVGEQEHVAQKFLSDSL